MTRSRSQMTLDVFEEEQQTLTDAEEDEAAALVDELEQPEPRTVTPGRSCVTHRPTRPRDVSDDTIPAVAPRGALDVLREMEAAA